ncbi:hypothetical protein T492DRAFT_242361 [Pavlovales sp. CCMP2436]|nr:hypothetical protein T492DRAFT_242361 [Pavlovales sp. CCMP2436]
MATGSTSSALVAHALGAAAGSGAGGLGDVGGVVLTGVRASEVACALSRATLGEVLEWLASEGATPMGRVVRALPGTAAAVAAAAGTLNGGAGDSSSSSELTDEDTPVSEGGGVRPRRLRGLDMTVWQEPVSIHLGLHRLCATLVLECARADGRGGPEGLLGSLLAAALPAVEAEAGPAVQSVAGRMLLAGLAEYALLPLALCAQVLVGMWRRNGNAVLSQATNYAKVMPWSMRLRDRDALLLQYVGAHVGASALLPRIVHRFGLYPWLSVAPSASPPSGAGSGGATAAAWPSRPAWAPEHAAALTAELLALLANLATEMPPPAGFAAEREWFKRELAHRVAAQPATRSELADWLAHFKTAHAGDKLADADALVDEVAAPPANSGGGTDPPRLSLRTALWATYDPLHWHLTPAEHRAAAERQPQVRVPHVQKPSVGRCPNSASDGSE